MDNKNTDGWKLAWAGVGLIALNCLLAVLPPMVEDCKPLYYGIILALVVIDVAAVYMLCRKFFSRKK